VVFNFADLDRRQRSRYGSVIKTAFGIKQQPTDAAEFVSWLEHAGGIVAALGKRSSKATAKVEQSDINDTVRAMPGKAKVSISNGNNKFVVLLAKPIDSNTVEVVYQFEEDSIGDSLATKAYKAEKRASAAHAADKLASESIAQEIA
jgi:arsenate reductase-like glutaredoxin family protein